MPKPQQTYMQGARAVKTAVVAKDSKQTMAITKAATQDAFVYDMLKKAQLDRRKLGEIKSLAEAIKKGQFTDQKRVALLKGVKLLVDIAKHDAELGHASTTLVAPAKAFLHAAQQLKGATPNLAGILAPILLFVIVLDKFLAKPRSPGK
jgi:hypothetical protein